MNKNYFLLSAMVLGVASASSDARAISFNHDALSSVYLSSYQNSITPVSTQTDGQKAQAMIEKMGEKAIGFLSNGSLSQEQKQQEFRKLLQDSFDMATIGRFALGKNWKAATTTQQKEYQKLFEDLVVEVYSSRFNDYKGESFDVSSFQNVGTSDVSVTSYIVPNSGKKIKVDWRVRNKNGNYKIIDVVIEGISMSQTQRSDFSSVIARGGGDVDVLLAHLRK